MRRLKNPGFRTGHDRLEQAKWNVLFQLLTADAERQLFAFVGPKLAIQVSSPDLPKIQ